MSQIEYYKDASISKAISRPDGMAKATGAMRYVADLKPEDLPPDMLTGRFYRSPHPRGRITALRLPETPEGYFIVTASDIPEGGKNEIPMAAARDLPCFAEGEVRYIGQITAVVAGPDPAVVDELVNGIEMDVEPLPVCVNMDDSLAFKGGAIHGDDNVFCRVDLDRGDVDAAFSTAASVVNGTYETGFQEQFYMEGQRLITWREKDRIAIRGSMQCPYYVSHSLTHVLGLSPDDVRVVVDTVGGAFGGKEDYPEIIGAPLAVASWVSGRPIRMIMDRVEDLAFTSKRHPSRCSYKTALDSNGRILALDVTVDIDGGAYETYTKIVLMRAVFHSLGVYNFPAFRVRGRGIATNTVPSGAFRGFGAPQSIFGIEMHMEELARRTGVEVLEYKKPLLLKKGDSTVTGGKFREEIILDKLVAEAEKMSAYSEKRARYAESSYKGIGMSFILHGAGFTGDGEQKIIKGVVALEKDEQGRVEILCAAVDLGQGSLTTFRKVVAKVLNLDPYDIVFNNPDTDRVPDSGPTVASRTMMVVGFLVQKAAEDLKAVWKDGEAQRVERKYEMPPGMSWDQETLTGDSYSTYGWGVNVCEVEVDPVTWETKVNGSWAVFDVGRAIDEKIVAGQIEGGMNQALGYGSMEKLEVDDNGRFRQITMSDYMVPTSLDLPRTGTATVDNPYPYGPFGAKGMGEMVHDGGHAAYAAAVEQAIGRPCPVIPLVPERIMDIMEEAR